MVTFPSTRSTSWSQSAKQPRPTPERQLSTPTSPLRPQRPHPTVRSTVDHDPPTPSRTATGPPSGSPSPSARSRIGSMEGEKIAPTVSGTKASVPAAPIAMDNSGVALPTYNVLAKSAPPLVNTKVVASTDRFDHVANDGRERGSSSPTRVSPATAFRAGRSAPSGTLCIPINWTAIPTAAPITPNCSSRELFAPLSAPTTISSSATPTAPLIGVLTDI